jgi:hypothetical protein
LIFFFGGMMTTVMTMTMMAMAIIKEHVSDN